MKPFTRTSVCICFFLFSALQAAASDFKLVKREKSISVYERWVDYHGHSVRELKVDFIARKGEAAKVIALLKDPSKGSTWNANAKSFRIALTGNETLWYNYVRYDIPWPLSDQDCSLKYYYNKNELQRSTCTIYFESAASSPFPVVKEVTRLTGTKGKWTIEKNPDGSLKISYQIITDKSSSVPRWLSDPIIHDNVISTMSSFRRLLEQQAS